MSEFGLLSPFFQKDLWVIHCDSCDHSAEIQVCNTDELSLERIAENTYLHYWIQELEFLEGLRMLIERYPTSPHPYKRRVLGEKPEAGKSKATDMQFEKELAVLLACFKRDRQGFFNLKARTVAAQSSIIEQKEIVKRDSLKCPKCGTGSMFIEPSEFTF